MRCNVSIYSDLVTQCDKSHTEKRFQNVQSRVKRVVATRVTCQSKLYGDDVVDSNTEKG